MKRNLIIILRTCDRVFALNGTRYVNLPKPEIMKTCVSSLVNAINQVENHDIKFFILDDHSSEETVSALKKITGHCKFPTEFISVQDGTGASYTCKLVYKMVEEHATDLWLHIEDDYVHFPESIQDMIDTVTELEENTGNMIAINPHDDIWRYTRQIYESLILLGPYRHYRTVKHSTYTCLASRQIYDKYKHHFSDAAEWICRRDENETINQVWNKDDVYMFSPIPSLAMHIMDPSGKDPYIDFDDLWNSVPQLWK